MTEQTRRVRTGNRIRVPDEGTAVCASCLAPRGNQTRRWVSIIEADKVIGYTCPTCPRVDEPIRRVESTAGARFRVVVDATPPGALKRRQVTRTLPTINAARAEVDKIRAEVRALGAYAPPAPESIAALAERWLESRVDVRPVTVEGYRSALTGVTRRLGSRSVQSITAADVRDLVAWLATEGGKPRTTGQPGRALSPRAVRASLAALVSLLDVAVDDGLIERNVARGVKRPRQQQRAGRDLEHWQPADLLKFRRHADADAWAAAWRLTLTGMRRSEVLGMRWVDVDLEAGSVAVEQGRVQLQYGGQRTHVDAPKSAASRRVVPVELLHPGTVAQLRSLKASQAADRLRAGTAYVDSGYVVVDALGQPVRPEVYSDRFRRLCTAAGAPPIRLHSVRHSVAFWAHAVGVTPADAAALLGHGVPVHLATYLPGSGTSGIAAAAAALGRAAAAAE